MDDAIEELRKEKERENLRAGDIPKDLSNRNIQKFSKRYLLFNFECLLNFYL